MWIQKIEGYFSKYSEYDNNTLSLHIARDFITILDSRISFILDEDDATVSIIVKKYGTIQEEDCEVDEEGFMYWLQMNFHKELVDVILSLKEKFSQLVSTGKKLQEESKTISQSVRNKHVEAIKINNSELEKIKELLNKVESYRRHIFSQLKNKEDVESLVSNIRILKEQST